MDIYSFINSPDVAAHCREINKTWNPFEMAVIISRSHKPMTEKHAAWRELISDYPDMPTPKGSYHDSLHQELTKVINGEDRLLYMLKYHDHGDVYTHKAWRNGETLRSEVVLCSFDEAWNDAVKQWEGSNATVIYIRKVNTGEYGASHHEWIQTAMDFKGNVYFIDASRPWGRLFPDAEYKEPMFRNPDEFFVDIPMPFKRGDILTVPRFPSKRADAKHIFVLDNLACFDDRYATKVLDDECECNDMDGRVYIVDNNGILHAQLIHNHYNYEYYRGELKGKDRLLQYASQYLKDEIDLAELIQRQCKTVLEITFNKAASNWYTYK